MLSILKGTLEERGTRAPLADAEVTAVPSAGSGPLPPVTATTGLDGRFELDLPAAGSWDVTVAAPAHAPLHETETLGANQSVEVLYRVDRTDYTDYVTVVHVKPAREEVARTTLSHDEVLYIPGTNGDAIRSITNLPGLARPPFNTGLLIIEGSSPQDSAVFVGGGEIQQLFHFEALSSTFNSGIVGSIDYLPSNFSVRYGRVTGGIVDVTPKPGRSDGYHGYGDISLIDGSALIQGPLGQGSFALAGRRSTIDFWLPYVLKRAGSSLTIAPYYYDYQAEVTQPFLGGTANVLLFGSEDRAELVFKGDAVDDTTARHFDTDLYFHYLQPSWDYSRGPLSIHAMLQTGPELQRLSVLSRDIDQDIWNSAGRLDVGYVFDPHLKLETGLDIFDTRFNVDLDLPQANGFGESLGGGGPPGNPNAPGERGMESTIHLSESPDFFQPAAYAQLDLTPLPGLLFMPGVRADYNSYMGKYSLDPRFTFRLTVHPGTTLKGGIGLFHEAPQPWFFIDRTIGNPDLPFERAVQSSLGVEQELPDAYFFDVTGFYKVLGDMPVVTPGLVTRNGLTVAENYAPTQTGTTYGLQVLARKQLTDRWFGWIAYTLSKSTRQDAPGLPSYPFTFDQTHILTVIGSYKITPKWQLGARVLYSSGNMSTPVIGAIFNSDTNRYTPIAGATNAFRTPAYFQLDVRLDRRFIFDTWTLDLYVDVQNITNRANVEGFNYNFNYTQRESISGLPIIPSLGVRGEF
jgi:hypothetical protein